MDFTVKKYKELLNILVSRGYEFQTFAEYLNVSKEKVIILRHDVDLLPENSLMFAKIQKQLGIKGSYYFRAVPECWDEEVICQIENLGHEIGYHYENLTTCDGDINKGIQDFTEILRKLRTLATVSTICMHGSPRSKFDSRDIWKTFRYRDYGIIGEPYFDVDFNKVFYMTDTGRRWDGNKVSVRDKVESTFTQTFHSTDQIINAAKKNQLPEKIMFTFHPQRWHDEYINWSNEYILQNSKNLIKKYFYVRN